MRAAICLSFALREETHFHGSVLGVWGLAGCHFNGCNSNGPNIRLVVVPTGLQKRLVIETIFVRNNASRWETVVKLQIGFIIQPHKPPMLISTTNAENDALILTI